jgi:hypothetical protein
MNVHKLTFDVNRRTENLEKVSQMIAMADNSYTQQV